MVAHFPILLFSFFIVINSIQQRHSPSSSPQPIHSVLLYKLGLEFGPFIAFLLPWSLCFPFSLHSIISLFTLTHTFPVLLRLLLKDPVLIALNLFCFSWHTRLSFLCNKIRRSTHLYTTFNKCLFLNTYYLPP